MSFLNQFMALVAIGSFIKSLSDYVASVFAGQQGVNFVNTVEQGASYYFVNAIANAQMAKAVSELAKNALAPDFVPVVVGIITIVFAVWLLFKII